jgi:Integrase core domain
MHRDIARELECAAGVDLVKRRASLDVWVETFNSERPHASLGMNVPRDVYVRSSRSFDSCPRPFRGLHSKLGYYRRWDLNPHPLARTGF